MANGFRQVMDGTGAVGNAVIPEIPEGIGQAILQTRAAQ
jgi:hypothetical protein